MPDREDPMERSNEEQAEGSRENASDANAGSATASRMERGSGQPSQPDRPLPPSATSGGADAPPDH